MISTDMQIAVPQADDLDKVFAVAELVHAGHDTTTEIAQEMGMVGRQGLYYSSAAEILRLVDIDRHHNVTLTQMGESYVKADALKRETLRRQLVFNTPIVKHVAAELGINHPSYEKHAHIFDDMLFVQDAIEELGYAKETALRRAFTLKAWVNGA